LQRLNTELGTTFVMVTHDPRAAAIATRKLRLEKGELREEEAPEPALAAHS
jgi:predicted ABC-type transport system involved in lysophospholipase L1 biosynthesis ATPase subunit